MSLPSKLQKFIDRLECFHNVDSCEVEKLEKVYAYVTEVSEKNPEAHRLDHAISVASHIASWRFGFNVIIAALVHDCPIFDPNAMAHLQLVLGEEEFSILKDFVEVHYRLSGLEKGPLVEQNSIRESFISNERPESFYIKIAERIDVLSRKRKCGDFILHLAQSTREILIPQVKLINAYKIVDVLEELCFQIENRNIYSKIDLLIKQANELTEYSRRQFVTRLHQIFDPNSKIVPQELRALQPYIKFFRVDERSRISMHRFITRTDSEFSAHSDIYTDLNKIKNICRTALCDLTLVIDDNACEMGNCSIIDFFMSYFEKMLQSDGVFLYGYYYTTHRDCCYYLLSDPMKNMYRFFIKTETDYLHYLYGNIISRDHIALNNVSKSNETHMKIFRRDGKSELVEEGISVLDFAFRIHKDVGLHFACAILNQNERPMPAHTILNNGDTVEIKKSDTITADFNWFRYLKTDYAKNCLIKHFKEKYPQHSVEAKSKKVFSGDKQIMND